MLVLGAGPAGVGAALLLARSGKADVLALERQSRVGGNSGSFELDGVHCDYGSHRLHAATEPHVMAVIEDAVGDDLVWRPRHGRILLKGRWIHFPLRPLDLIAKLPKPFAAALAFDAISKPFRRKSSGAETFATRVARRASARRSARTSTIRMCASCGRCRRRSSR